MNLKKIEERFEASDDGKCATAEGGMVATAFPEATRAGVEMLKAGGNVVDAACAAAFALTVCEPQGSGIGGQSNAILHFRGKTRAIDGSGQVPALAHIDRLNGREERSSGYTSCTVPSTPAVLGYLHFRYGRLQWRTLLEPAIRIAREGYRITPLQNRLLTREAPMFLAIPSRSGARYFLKDGNRPYEVGDRFCQPDLANLLEQLADQGAKAFYTGPIALRIDEDMREHGGFLRNDDLALIPWPVERKCLARKYRKIRILTTPPPAMGRTLLLVLQMLANLPSKFLRTQSPRSYHFIAETFRKALMNHKERPYGANTYRQLPDDKKILSRAFAHKLSSSIRNVIDPTLPLRDLYPAVNETTHLSAMDAQGNAIGITQSIELVYGSKAAAGGLGFLYNNYLNSLDTNNPAHPYYLRPGAVPWGSSAPFIAFHQDKPWIVAGSPGSDRIFSVLSQFLFHIIDGNMTLGDAMRHPRFHCSVGGKLSYEAERFDPEVVDYLRGVGYKMDPREPYAFYLGAVHAVLWAQTTGQFQGVAEIRRDGIAEGP